MTYRYPVPAAGPVDEWTRYPHTRDWWDEFVSLERYFGELPEPDNDPCDAYMAFEWEDRAYD